MLNEYDKQDLIYVMKSTLLELCRLNPTYFGKNLKEVTESIKHELTYEQLLNLTFNPDRKTKYLSSDVLESVAVGEIVIEMVKMYPDYKTLAEGKFVEEISKSVNKHAGLAKFKTKIGKFTKSGLSAARKIAKTKKGKVGIGLAAAVGTIAAATLIYRKFIKKGFPQCKHLEGASYKKCVNTIKSNAHKEAIRALRTALGQCSQARDVKKCKEKYQKEIKRREDIIKSLSK